MSTQLVIDALAPKGDGIHHGERGRVYVARALPGETVRANVHEDGDGRSRGDIAEIITPSPHRVTPPCVHYDHCGGCALQHAEAAFYRNWKQEVVRRALAKQGLVPGMWAEPVFVPPGSRRRVTFAAIKKNNAVTLGFFRRRSHDVAEITACLVADPVVMDLCAGLRRALAPVLRERKPADVFIQVIGGLSEVVITGPVGKTGKPDLHVREATARIAHDLKIARFSWRAKDRGVPEILVERTPLIATFGALSVALPPLAFLQPTAMGEAALVDAVMAALPAAGKFADLFSGCGTFSGPMLARGPVDAFESAVSAVRALDAAKGAAPLQVARRDLFREPLQPSETKRYDAVVFDPPRAGAQAQAAALAGSKVSRVIGVSCNPVTFARDAKVLVDGGYRLDSVKVIDQFTWSHHVEVVGVFSKDRK